MTAFITILEKELLEIYRRKFLLILLIIFGFIAISSPVLAKLLPTIVKNMPETPGVTINMPEPTWKDAIDQLIKNLLQFGLIVIVFMFSGSITEEKNKKTLEMVLTKPISRQSFILAKFFAAAFTIITIFILAMIVFYLYTVSLFGTINLLSFILLAVFLLILMLTVLALTIFSSTVFSNQIVAASITFVVCIIFPTLVGYIKKIANLSPSYTLSHYKDLMASGKASDFLPSLFASIGLIIILVIAATFLFKKQETER